jgi:hypothetical protein
MADALDKLKPPPAAEVTGPDAPGLDATAESNSAPLTEGR